MTTPGVSGGPPAIPQPVTARVTRNAIFLVVTLNPGAENRATVRSFCRDMAALVRSVGHRVSEGELSCIMALGSEAWDPLFGQPRPAELRRFRERRAEFGTYFIGYSRSPGTIEQMLQSMFVGKPQGNYDRLLDFSRVTGTLFFVPAAIFLEKVAVGER